MKLLKRFLAAASVACLCAAGFSGCGEVKRTIVFADAQWDSLVFHNAVAGIIAEAAYGFDSWSNMTGTTTILHEGIIKGDVDVHMEVWTDNIASYREDVNAGKLTELGVNFDDNRQGIYVPRYVIEGDPERGIEAVAPELRTVEDLKKYKDVFKDDEQPGKGRIYGAIPGWVIDTIMHNKYKHYGLDQDFVYFRPGSQAAMDTAFTSAYDKGKPIAGYYWEPTWLMGKYDFVLLEDAPYTNEEDYLAGKTACPSVVVTIAASNDFVEREPEFCEFLKKYKTSSALTSEALAYMQDTGKNHIETAKWFLTEHDELLNAWLDADKAQLVRDYISE